MCVCGGGGGGGVERGHLWRIYGITLKNFIDRLIIRCLSILQKVTLGSFSRINLYPAPIMAKIVI